MTTRSQLSRFSVIILRHKFIASPLHRPTLTFGIKRSTFPSGSSKRLKVLLIEKSDLRGLESNPTSIFIVQMVSCVPLMYIINTFIPSDLPGAIAKFMALLLRRAISLELIFEAPVAANSAAVNVFAAF